MSDDLAEAIEKFEKAKAQHDEVKRQWDASYKELTAAWEKVVCAASFKAGARFNSDYAREVPLHVAAQIAIVRPDFAAKYLSGGACHVFIS
jgi:hypothetical protein